MNAALNVEHFDLDYFLPMKDKVLNHYTSIEKVLVVINVILFALSFQCQDVDSEVSTALIYIMFAIAYFIMTTTCLTGAASIKGIFSPDQNDSFQDDESSKCDANFSNPGIHKGVPITKKSATKKTSATLLKGEKKEL